MAGVLDCIIIIIKAVLGGWTTDRTRIIHIADELTDGPLAGWLPGLGEKSPISTVHQLGLSVVECSK